jgi:RES domain-containing protein
MLHGARWNSPGQRVIYAAETYAGALLEILVHSSGRVPRSLAYVEIEIPSQLRIEVISAADMPGWDEPSFECSRALGDHWYDARPTPVLVVPSITRVERNILIHQEHPDFSRMRATAPLPVRWDAGVEWLNPAHPTL